MATYFLTVFEDMPADPGQELGKSAVHGRSGKFSFPESLGMPEAGAGGRDGLDRGRRRTKAARKPGEACAKADAKANPKAAAPSRAKTRIKMFVKKRESGERGRVTGPAWKPVIPPGAGLTKPAGGFNFGSMKGDGRRASGRRTSSRQGRLGCPDPARGLRPPAGHLELSCPGSRPGFL